MNRAQAFATVWAVAVAAVLWLLLPGAWRGLTAVAALGWWGAWVILRGSHGRHELDEDQADELDWPPLVMAYDAGLDWQAQTGQLPSADEDPVGHYAMLAHRYVPSEPWQQRAADDTGPHLLTAPVPAGVLQTLPGPVPDPGGPAAAEHDTGEAAPPADLDEPCSRCGAGAGEACYADCDHGDPPELDHTADPGDQAAELVALPSDVDLAAELAFEDVLTSTRWAFARLREAYL